MIDATERARLAAHRGLATWGERRVPLAEFRAAAAECGVALTAAEREAARRALLAEPVDETPVEGPFSRIAVCGGVYSNRQALAACLEDAAARGAEAVYCLGDLGGFGPHPEACWPLLLAGHAAAGQHSLTGQPVRCVQGNYEQSLASLRDDCNCGYTDPRDNHFARALLRVHGALVLAGVQGLDGRAAGAAPRADRASRRRARAAARARLAAAGQRVPLRLDDAGAAARDALRRGALRRLPLHAHRPAVGARGCRRAAPWSPTSASSAAPPTTATCACVTRWFTAGDSGVEVEIVRLAYDHRALAAEMRDERLPEEFVATIESGWWTTCLEVLPAREREASRF